MTHITNFTAVGQQQLSMAQILTAIEREEAEPTKDPGRNGHDCDVEATCHAGHGINGGAAFPYVCGFRIAGNTWGCPRRRRGGHPPKVTARPLPEPEPIEERSIILNRGGKKMVWWSKKDETCEEIVVLYPDEYRPPKRW